MKRKVSPLTDFSQETALSQPNREGESSEKTGFCFELQLTATCLHLLDGSKAP